MTETPRTPTPVLVSCPVCGEGVKVLVVVDTAHTDRPLRGDAGYLRVDFEQGWGEHACR